MTCVGEGGLVGGGSVSGNGGGSVNVGGAEAADCPPPPVDCFSSCELQEQSPPCLPERTESRTLRAHAKLAGKTRK